MYLRSYGKLQEEPWIHGTNLVLCFHQLATFKCNQGTKSIPWFHSNMCNWPVIIFFNYRTALKRFHFIVFDLEAGFVLCECRSGSAIYGIGCSTRAIAVSSWTEIELYSWDGQAATFQTRFETRHLLPPKISSANGILAYRPTSEKRLHLFDAHSDKEMVPLEVEHDFSHYEMSSNGSIVLLHNYNGFTVLYCLKTGSKLFQYDGKGLGLYLSLVSHDCNCIAFKVSSTSNLISKILTLNESKNETFSCCSDFDCDANFSFNFQFDSASFRKIDDIYTFQCLSDDVLLQFEFNAKRNRWKSVQRQL